jgi:hypothetical protein
MDQELLDALKDHTRVVLDDVCLQNKISNPNLSVWVRDGQEWQELSNRTVLRMWHKSGSQSFCKIMLREFLGVNAVQYQIIRRKFNDPAELSGIYANSDLTDFIIVVDLPTMLSTSNLIAGVGTAAVVGSGLYGSRKAYQLKSDNDRYSADNRFLDSENAKLTKIKNEHKLTAGMLETYRYSSNFGKFEENFKQLEKNTAEMSKLRNQLDELENSSIAHDSAICKHIRRQLDTLERDMIEQIKDGQVLTQTPVLCKRVRVKMQEIEDSIEYSNEIQRAYTFHWNGHLQWMKETLMTLQTESQQNIDDCNRLETSQCEKELHTFNPSTHAEDLENTIIHIRNQVKRKMPNQNNITQLIFKHYIPSEEKKLRDALTAYNKTEIALQKASESYNARCSQKNDT